MKTFEVMEYDYPIGVRHYLTLNALETQVLVEWLRKLFLEDGYSDAQHVLDTYQGRYNFVTPPVLMLTMHTSMTSYFVNFCIYGNCGFLHLGCDGGMSDEGELFRANVRHELIKYVRSQVTEDLF